LILAIAWALTGLAQEPPAERTELSPTISLPPGFGDPFMLPDADTDQYGNPVVTHNGRKAGPATGLAYEIWLNLPAAPTAAQAGAPGSKDAPYGVMELVLVPTGTFKMGSSEAGGEQPVHEVRLAACYIGKHEVTNKQFKEFVDANPQWSKNRIDSKYHDGQYLKHWAGDSYPSDQTGHPVVYVSWFAAKAYCEWASSGDLHGRLPTEAEWEYACRAGSTTTYCSGNDTAQLGDYAWYGENSGGSTHPVGGKRPNQWGIHDVHGNAWEWCSSKHQPYPYRADDGREDLEDLGSPRVFRGGAWHSLGGSYSTFYCRSAGRGSSRPTYCRGHGGSFRVCVSLPASVAPKVLLAAIPDRTPAPPPRQTAPTEQAPPPAKAPAEPKPAPTQPPTATADQPTPVEAKPKEPVQSAAPVSLDLTKTFESSKGYSVKYPGGWEVATKKMASELKENVKRVLEARAEDSDVIMYEPGFKEIMPNVVINVVHAKLPTDESAKAEAEEGLRRELGKTVLTVNSIETACERIAGRACLVMRYELDHPELPRHGQILFIIPTKLGTLSLVGTASPDDLSRYEPVYRQMVASVETGSPALHVKLLEIVSHPIGVTALLGAALIVFLHVKQMGGVPGLGGFIMVCIAFLAFAFAIARIAGLCRLLISGGPWNAYAVSRLLGRLVHIFIAGAVAGACLKWCARRSGRSDA